MIIIERERQNPQFLLVGTQHLIGILDCSWWDSFSSKSWQFSILKDRLLQSLRISAGLNSYQHVSFDCVNGQGSPHHTTKWVLTYSGLHQPIILTRSSSFFFFLLFILSISPGRYWTGQELSASLSLFHERNQLDQRFDYPFIKRFRFSG